MVKKVLSWYYLGMILVISSKTAYATERLVAEARSMGYEVSIMETAELAAVDFNINITPYSCLYVRDPYVKGSPKYLPEIIELAKKFKQAGKKVVDANIADGKLGEGKWVDYQALEKAGLPIPETLNYELGIKNYAFYVPHPSSLIPPPYVLKWIYGFKAENVFLVQSQKDLEGILKKYPKEELLFQEYIKADFEYKVITVGYKSLPVVVRFEVRGSGFKLEHDKYEVIPSRHSEAPAEEFQTKRVILHPSAALGIQDDAIARVVELAERASKALGRELSKVDILQKGNNLYILEVNRFPGLESFEKLTKYNATKKILQYLALS